MSLLEPLFRLSEICSQKNIEEVVICPGSRSAALTLAFNRNPNITTKVIADERSAAFVGLGMAHQSGQTVAMVCTSGSAALNFAPAISEAFFQEIPMLILTADRPPEWIHQYDGQTIFQKDIYGKHVKKAFELPVDYSHSDAKWQLERVVNEAIALTQASPKGPVHINVPIREPFYPSENEKYFFTESGKTVQFLGGQKILDHESWLELIEIWEASERKLIAIGQNQNDLDESLQGLVDEEGVVVLADLISNVDIQNQIKTHDLFLGKIEEEAFTPDLLITVGKSFISKTFKQFIRRNKPKYHFHIQENSDLIDPLQSITHKIEVSPEYFLKELFESLDIKKMRSGDDEDESDYALTWNTMEEHSLKYLHNYLINVDFGELKATSMLLESLPAETVLHLGNSMPVRYGNYLAGVIRENIKVSANRGTSGIDGIVSTAIGQALQTDNWVVCLVGDVSFFYDSNALFNAYLPKNLRVVVINNAGGNIFRIIDGPSKQPELEDFFVTSQVRSARSLCIEAGVNYYKATDLREMSEVLAKFFEEDSCAALLEVCVDGEGDANIFKELKSGFIL